MTPAGCYRDAAVVTKDEGEAALIIVGESKLELGALAAGIAWIGMYAGISYFLGEEIARLVGNVGTAAVLGVLVVVAAGLAIRVWVARRRNARHGRPAEQGVSQQHDRAAP